jgi:RsiW-degrading membrane proteinase PrsW (M82 family)
MIEGKDSRPTFFGGVGRDLLISLAILGIVVVLSLVFGTVLVFFLLIGEAFAVLGTVLIVLSIPVVFLLGFLMNRYILARSGKRHLTRAAGLSRRELLRISKDRYSYIFQRFTSLGIILGSFFISMFVLFFSLIIINMSMAAICFCGPLVPVFLLLSITLPPVAWITFTYAFSPYDPQPRTVMIIAMLWGMLSTFPSLFLNTSNSLWMEPLGINSAVASAPVVEEFFKMLGFLFLYTRLKDEKDGVFLGACFGAGFALIENFYYSVNTLFSGAGALVILLILFRSFFNVLGHMIGQSIIGFLIGALKNHYSKRRSRGAYVVLLAGMIFIGYIAAVVIHAVWNLIASMDNIIIVLLIPFGFLEFMGFVLLVLITFVISTSRFNRRLERYS